MLTKKTFLFGFILTLILAFFTVFSLNQEIYTSRLYDMNNCIQDKQIPCRWVPATENLYGSPMFNYLPPLPYYLGETLFLITGSLALAVKILLFAGLLGTYIFACLLTHAFFKKSIPGVLPIIFTGMSFMVLFFLKEGLGFVWGLMLLPVIILSLKRFFQKRNINSFLLVSFTISFLVLSSYLYIILVGLFFLWILLRFAKDKDLIFFAVNLLSIIFAILLSAFYFFPAVLERNLLSSTKGSKYLPTTAEEKPKQIMNSAYEVLVGDSIISNYEHGSNWLKFKAETKTHSIIRLAQFYFPDWKIFVDGKEIQVEYKNNSLGLMTIIIGEGHHDVAGKLFDTTIRSVSNTVSVIALTAALFLWVSQLKCINCGINYYRKRMN